MNKCVTSLWKSMHSRPVCVSFSVGQDIRIQDVWSNSCSYLFMFPFHVLCLVAFFVFLGHGGVCAKLWRRRYCGVLTGIHDQEPHHGEGKHNRLWTWTNTTKGSQTYLLFVCLLVCFAYFQHSLCISPHNRYISAHIGLMCQM